MAAINVTLFLPMIVRITQTCPRTADGWREASDRLGCQYDSKDVKNRYHCVPNQDKSSLLEFCYDKTRTLVMTGNCLELVNSGSLNFEGCDKSFSYGCPTDHYYSDEMYKHPACLEINTEKKCFVAANGCGKPTYQKTSELPRPRSTSVPNITRELAENGNSIGYILLGVFVIVVVVLSIIYKRKAICNFMMSLPCGSRPQEDLSHQAKSTNSIEVEPLLETTTGQAHGCEVLKLELEAPKTSTDECQKIVVAVDFGSSYSGLCFSTNEDYKKDPLKITSYRWKFSSYPNASSTKTPTSILLDKDKQVKKFGFRAEMEYIDKDENEQKEHFYFHRFRMEISRKIVTKGEDLKIQDVSGKELSASFVIGRGIQYLKKKFLRQIDRTSLENIYWVFTYPSLWDFDKQEILEKAVKQSEIPKSNYVLVEEAHAVSYYLHHLQFNTQYGTSNATVFVEGRKYILLDAGGETININVNVMQRDGSSKTLTKCSGPYGAISVDKAFESTICSIVGQGLMDNFIKTHPVDYIDMMKYFEARKGISNNAGTVVLRIPTSLKDMYEAKCNGNISNAIQKARYHGKLKWEGEKLRMTNDFYISLFDEAFKGIKQLIKEILDKEDARDADIILMVGGFSGSSQLQRIVLDKLKPRKVISLEEPELAVLKGAVLYGHQPVVFHPCKK